MMNISDSVEAARVQRALDFSVLPGFSRLFADVVAGNPFLMSRLPGNASPARVRPELISERLAHSYNRSAAADAVRETMAALDLHPLQQENLAALEDEKTAVVVTGQQAGLFGGPLYTLLKAVSAVATAQELQGEHPDVRLVPVFWVEDNDHDFDEIAHAAVFDRDTAVQTIGVDEPSDDNRVPIGARRWSDIETAVDELVAALQPTDFTNSLVEILRSAYASGQSITTAFVHTLNYILASTGTLFVSAYSLQQRGLMAPVLRREIERAGESKKVIEEGIAPLREQGYHIQAEPLAVNCMMLVDGKRHRIDAVAEGFRAGDLSFTKSDLLALVDSEPRRFSPTVLTRPLVQDNIFPTIAYIAGPGEMAYAAELKELYETFDSSMPAFLPRHSATLTERKTGVFLDERQILPETLFRPFEQVEKEFMASIEDSGLSAAFAEAEYKLREVFARVEEKVGAVDATLVPTTAKALTSTLQQLEQLSARAMRARKKQEEVVLGKLRQAHTTLFPSHSLQERTVNWVYFANKFGADTLLAVLRELTSMPPLQHYFPVIAFRQNA